MAVWSAGELCVWQVAPPRVSSVLLAAETC